MKEKKKLELEIGKPITLQLLFDQPIIGQSRYGEYFLYSVKNGTDVQYSFFAPGEVNEKIKSLRKGDRFEITKIAKQVGSKINISYEVKVMKDEKTSENIKQDQTDTYKSVSDNDAPSKNEDNYFQLMMLSCRDAVKIQNELGGMMDAKSLAVSLFIARSSKKQ